MFWNMKFIYQPENADSIDEEYPGQAMNWLSRYEINRTFAIPVVKLT